MHDGVDHAWFIINLHTENSTFTFTQLHEQLILGHSPLCWKGEKNHLLGALMSCSWCEISKIPSTQVPCLKPTALTLTFQTPLRPPIRLARTMYITMTTSTILISWSGTRTGPLLLDICYNYLSITDAMYRAVWCWNTTEFTLSWIQHINFWDRWFLKALTYQYNFWLVNIFRSPSPATWREPLWFQDEPLLLLDGLYHSKVLIYGFSLNC